MFNVSSTCPYESKSIKALTQKIMALILVLVFYNLLTLCTLYHEAFHRLMIKETPPTKHIKGFCQICLEYIHLAFHLPSL